MGYVRITIYLIDGSSRSGVRSFAEPVNIDDICKQARQLAGEVLGRSMIEDVTACEVPATDPAVVALILREEKIKRGIPPSDGTHPFVRQQRRKPLH